MPASRHSFIRANPLTAWHRPGIGATQAAHRAAAALRSVGCPRRWRELDAKSSPRPELVVIGIPNLLSIRGRPFLLYRR